MLRYDVLQFDIKIYEGINMLPLAVEIVEDIQSESLPNGENQQKAMKFVELLLSGYSNEKAWRTLHPDAYDKALSYGGQWQIRSRVKQYMNTKYVSQLLDKYSRDYWHHFLSHKIEQLEWLHSVAMDDGQETKIRLEATKIFQNFVKPPTEKIEVNHNITLDRKDEYKKMLEMRKQQLFDVANS